MNKICMQNKKVSIVIPCLNEEHTLPIVIKKAINSMERLDIYGEVIVADNGSTDNSVKAAIDNGARVVHCQQKGYGSALSCGFDNANSEYVIMGDADDSYNFEEIDDFIKYLNKGYDFVIGTRLKGSIEMGAMPVMHRYIGTPILTFIINLFFKTKISDCNCGMRGLKKESFERLKLEATGMEFASEMIVKAGIMKLKIKEIPITLYPDKRNVEPHLHTWRDGWRHLRFILLFSPTYLFMIPGLFLLLLGFAFMIPAFLSVFGITGKVIYFHRTLLGGLLTILGYQMINMGLYAKAVVYARYKELRKYSNFIEIFYNHFTLERGVMLGILIIFIGGIIDTIVFVEWKSAGFGALSKTGEISTASTFIIIGFQTIFSACLLSILNIRNKWIAGK